MALEELSFERVKCKRADDGQKRIHIAHPEHSFSVNSISEKKADLWQRDSPDLIPTLNMTSVQQEMEDLKSPTVNSRYQRNLGRNNKVDAARSLIDMSNTFEPLKETN